MTAISALAGGTTLPGQQPERRNRNAHFLQNTQTGRNSLGYSVIFSRIVGIWMPFVTAYYTRASRIAGAGHGERFWRNVSC